MSLRSQVKSVLRPMVRAAWPLVETLGQLEARATHGASTVQWSDVWDRALDEALDALPALPDCPHDLYRELVKPTRAQKKHALVSEAGKPAAIISLRKCAGHWEPVTYQSLPGAIAPAVDRSALARALHALGLVVSIPAGMTADVAELSPSVHWAYDCHQIDLTGDYEAYWRQRKRQSRLRRALRDCQHFRRRVDGVGDLRWTVEQWREQWKGDPGEEVVAEEDRIAFWTAVAARSTRALNIHTLALTDGDKRVAGLVLLGRGDVVMHQCISRVAEYSDAGTAINIFAIEWAKAQGFRILDFGGGAYKRDWGPVGTQRYGAVFQPRILKTLSWAQAN